MQIMDLLESNYKKNQFSQKALRWVQTPMNCR